MVVSYEKLSGTETPRLLSALLKGSAVEQINWDETPPRD